MDHFVFTFICILSISTIKCAEITNGHISRANENQREFSRAYNNSYEHSAADTQEGEEIPDPSALIIPGYNLPGHLFNDGKPFYVEKDPLTGAIDFNSKTSAGRDTSPSDYDYIDEQPSTDIFDKSNIDRKDASYGSHRPNDVNQLTPNFHDFLHLPVKYNPEKYVYPLISSSYANTKIQGNVNSYNHKQYSATTYKPTVSPTYYTSKSSAYYTLEESSTTEQPLIRFTTQPPVVTTTKTPLEEKHEPINAAESYTSTEPTQNLLNSPMNHPSYLTTMETDYDYDYNTRESTDNQPMLTTEPPHNIYITNKPTSTTTKKPYSIFDEFFGIYDDPTLIEKPLKPPLFANVPSFHTDDKYNKNPLSPTSSNKKLHESNTDEPYYPKGGSGSGSVSHVYPESNENTMYEYEYDYNNYSEEPNNIHLTNASPQNETTTTTSVASTTITTTTTTSTRQDSSTHKSQENKNEINKNITFTKAEVNGSQNYSNFYHNYPVSNGDQKLVASNNNKNIKEKQNMDIKAEMTTERQDSNFISITSEKYDNYNNEYTEYKNTKSPVIYTQTQSTTKVTSMPLGENHPSNGRLPLISLTQDLKESLNREKVEITTKTHNPVQYEKTENIFTDHKKPLMHSVPSTSNIHIAPDQDVVSFVVGNQQNVDGGHFIGSAVKEEPYISNSFRPLYTHSNQAPVFDQIIYNRPTIDTHSYSPQTTSNYNLTVFPEASTTINVQPIRGSEASLSIGMPADEVKIVPGQVVDAKLDINDNIEFPKEPGTKVVFPEEDLTTFAPPNREVLSLYSKPMFHQLPSDLTPPSEPEVKPIRSGSPRPPWDPRPGHFYQGRPEYARPPRPHKPEVYKRIDGLPNILPQFRPNAKVSNGHYMDSVGTINTGYIPRQPLLDRPSKRPIGFFEKLHPPPPPPPPKRLHDLRKVTALEAESKHDRYRYEERILNIPNMKHQQEHFGMFQTPPKVPVANRKTEDDAEIATLQMLQAKQAEKLETIKPNVPPPFQISYQESTEKPLYVVYPVNSTPLKLDVLDSDKRETVVVGTRGEQLPLPPSKINTDTSPYDQKPLLKPKERNDSPILKPQTRPNIFPIKTDFPYILERPDPTFLNIPIPSTSTGITFINNLDPTISSVTYKNDYNNYQSNNQWTSIESESRIVNGNKINNDQISATLKTYTDKPIAIAYTPTEPPKDNEKYSIPNFGRPVISEIRSENNKNVVHHHGVVSNNDSEFTVSAVMHTHPQLKLKNQNDIKYYEPKPTPVHIRQPQDNLENHKLNLDVDTTHVPTKLDFQAPFHASVSVDSEYQGWSVVTRNNKNDIDRSDVNVTPSNTPETSSEFDIENFKPQLFGGFKPIYNYPNDKEKSYTTATSERQEK